MGAARKASRRRGLEAKLQGGGSARRGAEEEHFGERERQEVLRTPSPPEHVASQEWGNHENKKKPKNHRATNLP